MRILFHALNFAPEELGCGKYSGEMVHDLVAAGHRCAVVTAPPYYPQWRVWDAYSSWRYRSERIGREGGDAIEVIRCPLWAPARVSGLKRVLHLASFGLSSVPAVLWKAVRFRPDVIVTIEPTAFCMPTTWLAARLCGAKAWLHVQDFEVDAAFELGILRSRLLRRAILAAESFLLKRFDRVSTISPNMQSKLCAKGVARELTSLFPNWVDCSQMRPLWPSLCYIAESDDSEPRNRGLAARRRFGIDPDAFVALYAGSIGDKQGLEVLVDAAKRLRESQGTRVRFVVCGEGSGRARLAEMAEGLENLQMLPVQPSESFNELMNCADVHLLPQKAGAADLVMPSKLTGMLATGRPVVACAAEGTQIAAVVEAPGAEARGLVVPPGEAAPFADAIGALAKDPDRCRRLGAAARRYAVESLSRDRIMERFERELRALVGLQSGFAVAAESAGPGEMSSAVEGALAGGPHFAVAENPATRSEAGS